MPSENAKSSLGTVEIHPYVQARLRSLARQKETAGILLGTSENGTTVITGFKRVPPDSLRQAAGAAGPTLAGFYRLHTPDAPTLRPEEEELWNESPSRLYMLVKTAGEEGGAAGTVWLRDRSGAPVIDTISLDDERPAVPQRATAPVPQAMMEFPVETVAAPEPREPIRLPWRAIGVTAAVLFAGVGAYRFWPTKPVPVIAIDLQARGSELAATWEQKGEVRERLQSAKLIFRDGEKEQTIDLTRNFAPQGRVVLRPTAPNLAVSLDVRYTGVAPVTGGATYIGFVPGSSFVSSRSAASAEASDTPPKATKSTKKAGPRRRPARVRATAKASELNPQP